MPCTRRLKAYRAAEGGGISFSPRDGFYDRHLELPCGQCIDCRLKRAREWALRMMHETRDHSENCFVTLTYDNESLPADHSLDVRTWQLFAKRLRKKAPFRFYHVGEYGEQTLRPHYHAIIFGQDFNKSRRLFKTTPTGHRLYTSSLLDEVWPHGHHLIGDVSFDSCCYVARYVTKKITGDAAKQHYQRLDPDTGEVFNVKPEYATMSRRPGIGQGYFEKWKEDIYKDDTVISSGREYPPPRYYDQLLANEEPERYATLQKKRRHRALVRNAGADLDDRSRDREAIQKAKLNLNKRPLDREI